MNFFMSSLTSLLQFNLFWSSKPIIWHFKTYHFANQNKLFCSSDVSDDTKKFVTLFNELIFSGLSVEVTKSAKKYVWKFFASFVFLKPELFPPPLITILVITKTAGVIEIAHVCANAYDTADWFDGGHETWVAKGDAAGLWGGEVREEQVLLWHVPPAVAWTETVGALHARRI